MTRGAFIARCLAAFGLGGVVRWWSQVPGWSELPNVGAGYPTLHSSPWVVTRQTLTCREALERYGPDPVERVELWGDSLPVHDGAFLHSAFGGCFMTVLHGAVTTGEGRRFDLWTQPGQGNVALSVSKWAPVTVEERDAIQVRGTSCFGLCVSPVAPVGAAKRGKVSDGSRQ